MFTHSLLLPSNYFYFVQSTKETPKTMLVGGKGKKRETNQKGLMIRRKADFH